jgi:hypothetical protein
LSGKWDDSSVREKDLKNYLDKMMEWLEHSVQFNPNTQVSVSLTLSTQEAKRVFDLLSEMRKVPKDALESIVKK